MMNPKDTIKEVGQAMRSSNSGHQAMFRARLEVKAGEQTVSAPRFSWLRPSLLLTSGVIVLVLVIATHPERPVPVAYNSGPINNMSAELGLGSDSGGGLLDRFDDSFFAFSEPTTLTQAPVAGASPGEILDYENEHGSMLDVKTIINLWSTKDDLVTPVQDLFESFGGHIGGISQYAMDQPTHLTGLVPADSYFLFREQLRDLVSADKYMTEVLNANDLIPSAINIEESITEVTEVITKLKDDIAKTENATTKAALQRQLDNREMQLENLIESRADLDENVEYVKVTVMVTEIPSFRETREVYDLHNLVMGIEKPGSFAQRALVNILIVGFGALQLLSVAIWFLIPVAIWLLVRRRQRLAWKDLD